MWIVVVAALLGANPEATRLAEEASAFAQAGELPKALERIERAHQLDPKDAAITYNLAQLREANGDRTGAASAYDDYLAQSPNAPDANDVKRRVAKLRTEPVKVPPEAKENVLKAQAY